MNQTSMRIAPPALRVISLLTGAFLFSLLSIQQGAAQDRNQPVEFGSSPSTPATPEATPADAPAPAATTSRPTRNVGEFPPYSATAEQLRRTAQPYRGSYLSMTKFVPVILLFLLWSWSSQWAYEDGQSLKLRTTYWSTMLLGIGTLGLLLMLIVPSYALGLLLGLAAYGVPLGLYIQERNERVPENAKILTPRHIQNTLIRSLARLGIHLGHSEAIESAIGPPIEFVGKSSGTGNRGEDRARKVESSPSFLSAKELVYDAILRRATDVHLEPKEDELGIRLRIDGVMYPTEPFDKAVGSTIINIFKILGGMDITEKRRSQDGSFRAEMELREIDFRVATQGTRYGEKMSLRILDQSNSVNKLSDLGMRKQLVQKLKNIIDSPHGMFLSCGPTGAGKSTTLYAALNELDAFQRNIITVEDPIEYKMENVTQIEINLKADQTFAKALRSILRQDPDVVMIGEIRDGDTARVACQAATTGHMVFSTVHANDSFTALNRLMDLDVETHMVADSITGIMGQRLARRLCVDCKEAYKPKPEFLQQANLPVEKIEKFYRPPKTREQPCTTCGDLGFRGRVGVYELLEVNDRMRDLVREKSPMSNIKAEARKNGFLYMKEEGIRLVVRGITSIDELMRVVK